VESRQYFKAQWSSFIWGTKNSVGYFMSPSDNMSKMSLFFVVVYIKAIEDMVRKNIALFQEI
jgi:hypothetical protein